jgi:tetratricopeptide (TPR) repeat protein
VVYRQALRIAPEPSRIYSNLGYLRWMADDTDAAMAYYRRAIALDADYEVPLNNLGVIHLDMLGDLRQAQALFESAIAINPHYALAWYNLGRTCSLMDNRLEAARHFRRARELNGGSPDLDNDELTARINHLFDTCGLEHRD